MAEAYKLTPIELALSPMEQFENNLSKLINNLSIIRNYFYFEIYFDEWTGINPFKWARSM